MMKYYYKLQSKLITVLTFKNKENEWTFKIGSIIVIISLLLVFFYYFYENEFSKSTGFLKYLWLGIICAGIIVASMFAKVLNRELDNKDYVVNELKNLDYEKSNFIFEKVIENESSLNNVVNIIDIEIQLKLRKLTEKLQISEKIDFCILMTYINLRKYPLKKDVWIVEQFKNIFGEALTAQQFGKVKNEMKDIIASKVNLTSKQERYLMLYNLIDENLNFTSKTL